MSSLLSLRKNRLVVTLRHRRRAAVCAVGTELLEDGRNLQGVWQVRYGFVRSV